MIFALECRWCSLILVVELLVLFVYDINSQIFGEKIEIYRNEKMEFYLFLMKHLIVDT